MHASNSLIRVSSLKNTFDETTLQNGFYSFYSFSFVDLMVMRSTHSHSFIYGHSWMRWSRILLQNGFYLFYSFSFVDLMVTRSAHSHSWIWWSLMVSMVTHYSCFCISHLCICISHSCIYMSHSCIYVSHLCICISRSCIHMSHSCIHLSHSCIYISHSCIDMSTNARMRRMRSFFDIGNTTKLLLATKLLLTKKLPLVFPYIKKPRICLVRAFIYPIESTNESCIYIHIHIFMYSCVCV